MTMLYRYRDFRLLFAGQVISTLGSGAAVFALPLLVLATTSSPAQAGLVGGITLTAYASTLLPLGVLADRLPARAAMIGADTTRAIATAAVVIAVTAGRTPLWLLIGFATLDTVLGTLFRASGPGALKRIVPGDKLVTALSWVQVRNSVAGIIAPPMGGMLMALHPALPFTAKAVAHLVSAATIVAIRTPLPGRARSTGRRGAELVAGIAFLWRDRFLRAALITAGAVNLAFGGVETAVTVGGVAGGASPESIGFVMGLAASGGLVGATLAPRLARRLSTRRAFLLVLGGGAVAVALMAVVPNLALLGVVFASAMVLPPVISVVVGAARIARAPDDLQGRAATAAAMLAVGAAPLGPVLGGLLVDRWASSGALLALGILLAVMALVAAASRALAGEAVPSAATKPPAIDDSTFVSQRRT